MGNLSKPKISIKKLWFIIASIALSGMFFSYYGNSTDIILKLSLSLGSILFIISLMTYEYKIHISMLCLFTSYLFKDIAQVSKSSFSMSAETLFSLVAVFSTTYLVLKDINSKENVGNGNKLTLKKFIAHELGPVDTVSLTRIVMWLLVISVIFQLTNSYNSIVTGNTDAVSKTPWIAVAYTILPLITVLLSIIPIKDVIILRIAHNLIWVYIIQLAVSIKMASQISMLEPIVYMITILISSKDIRDIKHTRDKKKKAAQVKDNTEKKLEGRQEDECDKQDKS